MVPVPVLVLVLAQAQAQVRVQDSALVPALVPAAPDLAFRYALRLTCIETENKRNNQ